MKSKILTMTAERSNIRAIVFLAFLSLTIALNPGTVSAITFTITSNIDWSAISGGPPGASDIVTVKNGATLTINVSDAVCGELNLGSGNPSGGDGTVSFNSGSLLTIITSTATVFIGKASGGGHAGFLDMTNGGKLICNTLTYIDGVFTPGAGTIEFQSTAATNLPAAFATYHNLVMNGTGSLKQGVNTSLTGDLDIHTGTFDTDASNNYNLDVTGNIRIDAPASFNANNSVITLQADLTNIGIFNKGNSTLTFDGAGAQQISGSSLNLYEFILNKSSGLLTLDINVEADKIQLNDGNLVLDNCHLSIDVAGISGGGSSSYVITDGTSYFSEGIASTGSYTFHVGDATNYTPFTITINSATFSGSDSLTLNVQASKHPNMGTGDHIKRYWTVDAGGFTALNYDVSYIYVDGDISGTEANLKSGSWDGSNWTQYFMVNAAANTLFSVGGITTIPTGFAFSGGSAAALPIELLNFEANVVRDMIRISWSTGSELNNDFFTIQRSIDGIEFEEIAQISGAGNSISTIHYEVLDTNAPYGLIYYRLKQTDYNGEFKLYPVVSVQYDYDIPFKVYPNPAFTTDKINIEFNQSSNATSINQPEELLVVLYDQMGRLVYSKIALIENDQINMAIDLNNMLSPGVYFIIGSSDNELHKQKLVIQ